MNGVINYLTDNFVNFNGRMSRANYWVFFLVFWLVNLALSLLGDIVGIFDWIAWLWSLAIILPQLGFLIRRLHDTNRSGWWILIALIPIVGWIILLVFTILEGTPGENQYGSPETINLFQ